MKKLFLYLLGVSFLALSACAGSSTSSSLSGASPSTNGSATLSSSTNFRSVNLSSASPIQGIQQSAHYRQIDPFLELNINRVQNTNSDSNIKLHQ